MPANRRFQNKKSRKSIDTEKDPYLPKKGLPSTCVCKTCHAVYQNKRWYLKEDFHKEGFSMESAEKITCPACRKIKDNYPGGLVVLEGDFLTEHNEEIFNLIRHEEQKALRVNPLERIMKISRETGRAEITTTNEVLAERIGNALYRAYKGQREIKLSHNDKFVRVYWKR